MGHLVGKDIFRQLGKKIDGLEMRAPWNDRLYAILNELYSPREAEVVIAMPYGLTPLSQLAKLTKYDRKELQVILDGLTSKGLVMDLWVNGAYHYLPSPMVIGIFEFTMMRMGPDARSKEWAKLFHEYLDRSFFEANYGNGEQITFMRALPYEETISDPEYVEVLDYEKASVLIENSDRFAIGLCSCRHEEMHLGTKTCSVPLESCTQFGMAAELMIRHGLAREVDKSEMREAFARSREMGLVLSADNVRKNMRFVCHCCKCCCHVLKGVNEWGYTNVLMTSTFIAGIDSETCIGCGKCSRACPFNAISMKEGEPSLGAKKLAEVDTGICAGCGVCALSCPKASCVLVKREQRVIHPESTFERIMLQCLEKGTLQNQLFTDPQRFDHKMGRVFLGAFLRLPAVKKALMSDQLRSAFLAAMKSGAEKQGKGWATQL